MELITTIPVDVMQLIVDKKVIEAGFGAGSSSVAGKVQRFPEPVELAEGISWVERYRHVINAAHLLLDDRTTLWFRRDGFNRYEQTPREKPPRPGVSVKTID